MSTYVLLKFLGHLALPPASIFLGIAAAGLLYLFSFRRLAVFVCGFSLAVLLLLSSAPVADALMAPLQQEARAEAKAAAPCCYGAILVLGGSITPANPPRYPEPGLVGSSDRLWQAARLYHRGIAPRIIVSGGMYGNTGDAPTTEAGAMRLFLTDLGVPRDAIVEEGRSLNTLENVAFARELVGKQPVALITSAYHMPRALRTARQAGLTVGAFPGEYRYASDENPWDSLLPSMNSISISNLALWEYLALAFDRRKGPIQP